MAQSSTTAAPHEMLELHELMRSEVIAIKKLKTSMPLVSDGDLKACMEQALTMKKNTLNQCEQLYFKMQHQRLQ